MLRRCRLSLRSEQLTSSLWQFRIGLRLWKCHEDGLSGEVVETPYSADHFDP